MVFILEGAKDADKKGFTLEGAKDAPPEEPGFFGRVGEDWSNRISEGREAAHRLNEGQMSGGAPLYALESAGKIGFGAAGDIGAEAIKSLADNAPEFIKSGAAKIGQKLGDTDIAVKGVDMAKGVGEKYSAWRNKHPDAAGALESIGDIAGFLPVGKGAKAITEAGVEGAKTAAKVATPLVKDAAAGALKGVAKVAAPMVPKIDAGLLPVVNLAQKWKVPLSLDEVTGSRALKNIQKVSQDLPFSGQKAFRDKQMAAWNKGILSTVGATGDRITPEIMGERFKTLGKKFDDLGAGKIYNLKGPFEEGINQIKNEAAQTSTKDAIANFNSVAKDIMKNVDTRGYISGEKLSKLRSMVNERMRKTSNYDTKQLLSDLEGNIIEMMTADPKVAQDFAETKKQYRNLIVLEPLVQKGKGGNISPARLSDRVAKVYKRAYTKGEAGDIGELARVGQELLPELGGSDTAAKSTYTGLAGGVGYMHPYLTAAGLAANRGFQEFLNRNQAILKNLRPQP